MTKRTALRISVAVAVSGLFLAFFAGGWGDYLSLAELKARHASISLYYQEHPLRTLAIYAGIYIAVAALSLPGAGIMSLAGGAIFGLWVGTAVVSVASTIGATCAFLIVRFLLHEAVQRRFSDQLRVINAGIERDGALYLLSLRLMAIFPFFIVNILMALTPIRTTTFYLVSQIGMIPATLLFVNAGTQLARISSPADILSPALLGSFVLLGLFPLLTKKLYQRFTRKHPL